MQGAAAAKNRPHASALVDAPPAARRDRTVEFSSAPGKGTRATVTIIARHTDKPVKGSDA